MANKEEFKNEEPVKIGSEFVVKVLLVGAGLVSIIIGVPYLMMHH